MEKEEANRSSRAVHLCLSFSNRRCSQYQSPTQQAYFESFAVLYDDFLNSTWLAHKSIDNLLCFSWCRECMKYPHCRKGHALKSLPSYWDRPHESDRSWPQYSSSARRVRKTYNEFKPTFLERLVAIIPQPRTHQFLYHGVFANNAKYRKEILPKYRRVRAKPKWKKLSRKDGRKSRHVAWAQLLWRSFGVMGWTCTHCKRMMRLRAVAIYSPTTTKILRGLGVNLHGLGCTEPP